MDKNKDFSSPVQNFQQTYKFESLEKLEQTLNSSFGKIQERAKNQTSSKEQEVAEKYSSTTAQTISEQGSNIAKEDLQDERSYLRGTEEILNQQNHENLLSNDERMSRSESVNNQQSHTHNENQPVNERELEENIQNLDECETKELIKKMGKVKAEFYLRHSMAFFLAFLFLAKYSLELIENRSCLKEILIVLYGYLCYAFLEEINFYFKFKTSDNDTKISYIYAGLDVFSLICSLILLHLKFLKILPPSKIASLPGLVICLLFYFSSYQRKSAKNLFLLKRFLEAVQIYLIEAKADGRLDLSWGSILVYTCIYITVRILLLITSLKSVKLLIPLNATKANILLSLWHCLYIGLLLIMIIIYWTYSEAVDTNGNFEILKMCLTSGQYFSALLFCYTIFTKPFLLMAFSRVSSLDYQSSEFGEIILDPSSIGLSRKIKVEILETYFSKISSTYYQHLKNGIIKNKEYKNLNALELRILYERAKELTKDLHSAYLSLTVSWKEKAFLKKLTEKNFYSWIKTLQVNPDPTEESSNSSNLHEDNLSSSQKLAHKKRMPRTVQIKNSIQDDDNILNEEESLCFVCFKEAANGVILECGHGGFCYSCAEKYLLMKNQCMSCRGVAERIAEIKMKPILGRIFKSSKVGKIMFVVDDNRCQWIFD